MVKQRILFHQFQKSLNWFHMNGYSNCAEETLEPAETRVFIKQGAIHFYTEEVAVQMLADHTEAQAQAPVVVETMH